MQGLDELLAKSVPELQRKMIDSVKIDDESIMICVPHHCKDINTIEEGMYPGNHEYPLSYVEKFCGIIYSIRGSLPSKIYTNVSLSYCASHKCELVVNLHKELKKIPILFIGNHNYSKDFLEKLFGDRIDIIPTNERNSFFQHDFIFENFDKLYIEKYNKLEYFIIIMAAGCAGRAFSGEIYTRYYTLNKNFFILDYGSLIDYLWGDVTRAYMELDPPNKKYILDNI
jgi:hypothetical protein